MGSRLILAIFTVVAAQIEKSETTGVRANVNLRHFSNLCRIYATALNPPTVSRQTQKQEDDLNEIRRIYVTLAPSDWYKVMSNATTEQPIPEDFRKAYTEYGHGWDAWRKTVRQMEERPGEYSRLDPKAHPVELARRKLEKVLKAIQALLEGQTKLKGREGEQDIRSELKAAAVGQELDESKPFGTTTGQTLERIDSCGKANLANEGQLAGNNLGIDITCLCAAGGSSDHQKDACGAGVGGTGTNSAGEVWSSSQKTAGVLNQLWVGKIKTVCLGERHPPATSTSEARLLLSQFLSNVEAGGECMAASEKRAAKPGLLGSWYKSSDCATGTFAGCNGNAASDGGACVYYGSKRGDKITWFNGVQQALTKLEKLQNDTAKLVHHEIQIRLFKTRAEEIYEEAKGDLTNPNAHLGLATQPSNEKQNPSTAAGQWTAQETATASTTPIHRFILPWTLFI